MPNPQLADTSPGFNNAQQFDLPSEPSLHMPYEEQGATIASAGAVHPYAANSNVEYSYGDGSYLGGVDDFALPRTTTVQYWVYPQGVEHLPADQNQYGYFDSSAFNNVPPVAPTQDNLPAANCCDSAVDALTGCYNSAAHAVAGCCSSLLQYLGHSIASCFDGI